MAGWLRASASPTSSSWTFTYPTPTGRKPFGSSGKLASTSRIPVIAVTALSLDGQERIELSDARFAGYIAKLIDIDEGPGLVRRFAAGGSE